MHHHRSQPEGYNCFDRVNPTICPFCCVPLESSNEKKLMPLHAFGFWLTNPYVLFYPELVTLVA